jgi:hypothetical protein
VTNEGGRAYVTGENDGTLTVVDARNNVVLKNRAGAG